MTDITIYGIKNCDTMKKALKWLEANHVNVTFHDYKKSGIDDTALNQALEQHGWENVINRRGTTWRQLPEEVKNTMNEDAAKKIAAENPSIIKRPLLVHNDNTHLGFNENEYKSIFKK